MKSLNRLSIAVVIVSTLAFAGCKDDVYDPNRVPEIPSKDNPMGDGFTAPAGFNWSMLGTIKLNAEVKDEFNGEFNYLVEVFTTNPLADKTATPIAAGIAKKGISYIAEITTPKALERIFIRQTDPKQRKEVYEYAVPENGAVLNCKLYNAQGAKTKAINNSTSAFEASKVAGFTEPSDPNYKEENEIPVNIPDASDATNLVITSNYTASNPYTGGINGKQNVYVKGTWKPSSLWDNANIYILSGGKIIADNIQLGNSTKITIQTGGEVTSNGSLGIGSQSFKNFGKVTASKIEMNLGGTPEVFNAGEFKSTNLMSINRAVFFNHGIFNTPQIDFTDIQFLNKGTITSNKINLNGGSIFNYNTIDFNENDGLFTTNNSTRTGVINHDKATLKGYNWTGGISVYNDGLMEFTKCINSSTDILYNSCTLIVKELFSFANVILDKGSITGGRPANFDSEEGAKAELWKPVQTIEIKTNPVKFILKNGSMIKAQKLKIENSINHITGEGEAISALQISEVHITTGDHTYLSGNLVVSSPNIIRDAYGNWITDGVANVESLDQSKFIIETCGGLYQPGNPGEEPFNPEIPTINDATKYTYVFEDNWPAYGDYDLNDLVLTLTDKKIEEKDGKATASFKISLNAVGANKILGAGVRFLKLSNDKINSLQIVQNPSSVPAVSAKLESGQDLPTILLFDDAHAQYGYTDSKPFINTSNGLMINEIPTYTISFQSTLSKKELESALNINNLDVFIVNEPLKNGKRYEVHLPGYTPTNLCNTKVFGVSDDASKEGSYYLSKNGLAWAIVVPNSFKWPQEKQNVTGVYNKFVDWVKAGGKVELDWYNNPTGPVFNPQK